MPRPETLYKFRFLDDTGAIFAQLGYSPGGDESLLRWFSYRKALGFAGILQFGLSGNHPVLELLTNNYQIEIWRQPPDADWYRDFTAIYRADQDYNERERLNFTARAQGPLSIIDTVIAWYAGYSNRSTFAAVAAETVLKTLVTYNATAAATAAAGRDLDFSSSPFTVTVQADGGGGNAITKACSRKHLLETLRDVTRVGGGDFDLIRDSVNPLAWEFRWYLGQRGSDRSATVIFSSELGNLADFQYSHRPAGATVAIVGGPGERDEREITVVYASDYAADNHREVFINATDQATINARTTKGDEALYQLRAMESTAFTTRQVEGARYGVDYCADGDLGDLVSVVRSHDHHKVTHKISAATVSVNTAGENVVLETETP